MTIYLWNRRRGAGAEVTESRSVHAQRETTTVVTDEFDLIGNEIYPTGCVQITLLLR